MTYACRLPPHNTHATSYHPAALKVDAHLAVRVTRHRLLASIFLLLPLASVFPTPSIADFCDDPFTMSQSQKIQGRDASSDVAPTPQNTPLDTAVLANRPANTGKPQVEDIGEGEEDGDGAEDVSGINPASLLAQVSRFS